MFRVIPAVDLKDGKCVQLQQGEASRVLVELDNPVTVALRWVKEGARVLHVVDLSGAFGGKLFHERIILDIKEKTGAELQVGGGIRSTDVAERLIEKGIDRVILGTLAFKDIGAVKSLAKKYPERVMIAVDSRGGRVVVNGWRVKTELSPVELAKLYEDCDVSVLYTNVDVEGLMRGINVRAVEEIVKSVDLPVYVAGGISSLDDVRAIREAGAAGVVVGSAIYTGRLNLKDALALESY